MSYMQTLEAPDGTEMVLITRAEYDRLTAGDTGDARDIAAADRALADDARYPADVVDAMLAGATPIAAWRKHRGMSQGALAAASGVTQAAISRLEQTGSAVEQPVGRRATRQAIARALGVSLSALEPLGD